MSDLYYIAWRSKATGANGKGTGTFTLEEAQDICQQLDRESSYLEHWPLAVSECDDAASAEILAALAKD